MLFYSDKSVYEAAKDRIRWIFNEFPERKKVVSFSGGKDSTTVLHLVKEVMDELGIAKIPVFFCDQEAEAPQTIDYVRKVMNFDWVEPFWIQSFFQEWNSSKGTWFNVWGPGEKWCRQKEPNNPYVDCPYDKTRHFGQVLDSMLRYHFGDDYVALGGVRIDESPTRRVALTTNPFYKDITWGKGCSKGGYVFYPIWDWNYKDVWYYIFTNHFPYCKLYDYLFTKKPLNKCRVSSYIHENAIQDLKNIKEIAPKFYSAALARIENINSTVQSYDMLCGFVGSLPQYFSTWEEYVIYLADNIVEEKANAERIKHTYLSTLDRWRRKFGAWKEGIEFAEVVIGQAAAVCVVAEDAECSKLMNQNQVLVMYKKDHYAEFKAANNL